MGKPFFFHTVHFRRGHSCFARRTGQWHVPHVLCRLHVWLRELCCSCMSPTPSSPRRLVQQVLSVDAPCGKRRKKKLCQPPRQRLARSSREQVLLIQHWCTQRSVAYHPRSGHGRHWQLLVRE